VPSDPTLDVRVPGSGARLAATLCSVLSALCLLALLPLLYLYADLLIWKGRVPSYANLSPARQTVFRDAWNAGLAEDATVKDALAAIRPAAAVSPESVEWEWRWQAATKAWLEATAGARAGAAYYEPLAPDGPKPGHVHSETRLGVLPTVAREHGRVTGRVLGVFARVLPWAWEPGEDRTANGTYLLILAALGFGASVVAGLAALAARHFAAAAGADAATRVRRSVYLHAFRLGAVAVSPPARAEAATILTDRADAIREGVESKCLVSARDVILVIGAAGAMLLVNPTVAVAVLAGGSAVWLVAGHVAAWFRRDARHAARVADAARGRLVESVERLGLVKSYLMDRFAQNRVERQLDESAGAERRRRRGHALSRPFLAAVGGVSAVALFSGLGAVVLGGGISLAAMAELLFAAGILTFAVRSALHAGVVARAARGAAADVGEFLGRRSDPGQSIDAEFLHPVAKRIEFHNVAVREPGSGAMRLEDVTCSIAAGTRVAVVAADRESLLAFARVLTRFHEPTAGEIKADGKNLRWVTVDSLRTQIAVVTEDALTFTDTVANNVGCGDPGFGLPQVMEACKVAHAHQFVQKLPYGYETLIGGPGSVLTPGQQYRLALARAILRDPSVLVVEEPTAALDPDTLALVDDTFARIRAGRTLIVLAHRETTMRSADQIIVLDGGKVVAHGSHEMLLQSSERYRQLGYRDVARSVA
jgi:ATP-binding cassette subfamily B protein